jgi:hypothetical protein
MIPHPRGSERRVLGLERLGKPAADLPSMSPFQSPQCFYPDQAAYNVLLRSPLAGLSDLQPIRGAV